VQNWPGFVGELHDVDLHLLVSAVHEEQQRRALAAGDPYALAEEAMQSSFDRRGLAAMPYVERGVLVCPGAVVGKSQTSHLCRFVVVDEQWVWDHPAVLLDRVDEVGHHSRKTVTLLPALAGMTVTAVHSKKSAEGHRRIAADTFTVTEAGLVEASRTVSIPDNH